MYLNEFDPFAADWLTTIYPHATIDTRSITDVRPHDVAPTAHFFAGIGGWPEALEIARWPDDVPVWTGSCPCQPYSTAGKRKGNADERDLWPEFARLILECRPRIVFGEQVPAAIGHGWIDRVQADLAGAGYAVRFAVLGAHSVGAPHKRQRLYWTAFLPDASSPRHAGTGQGAATDGNGADSVPQRGLAFPESSGSRGGLSDATSERRGRRPTDTTEPSGIRGTEDDSLRLQHSPSNGRHERWSEPDGRESASGCERLEHTSRSGFSGRGESGREPISEGWQGANGHGPASGFWSDYVIADFRDGKRRRVGRSVQPLAHGIPRDVGPLVARLVRMGHDTATARRIIKRARRNRVGRLKGYGNAIVPQVAAVFVQSVMQLIGKEIAS